MNDELMRKISDALDSEDGIAGDPELIKAMAESPDASKYARHLGRLQRWFAAWPLVEPDEDGLEALAQKVDARLGEKFSSDFTKAPDFEEEEEYATVTSGLLRAGDLESESQSSAALELTMSQITELADQITDESSAKSIARVPLKKKESVVEAPLPKGDPRSSDDDLPAPLARAPKPRAVPVPLPTPAGAAPKTTMIGHADPAKAAPTDISQPAAPKTTMIGHADPAKAAPTDISDPGSALPLVTKPKADSPAAPAAAKAPPAAPKVAAPAEAKASPKPEAPPAKPPAPTAKTGAKPAKPGEGDRVSIPMPAASGPRLELLEGGAAKAARSQPPKEESRSWLPGLLAAAAIGLGVIGVGTLMSSSGDEPSSRLASPVATEAATATGAVAPAASAPMAPAAPAPAPPPEPAAAPVEAPAAAVAATTPTAAADDGMWGGAAPAEGSPAPGGMRAPGPSAPAVARARPAAATPMRSGAARGSALPLAEREGSEARSERAARPEASEPGEGATAPRGGGSPAAGRGAGGAAPSTTASSGAAVGGGGAATAGGAATTAPAPRPAPPPPASTGPAGETLDRATVQSVMGGVEPAVRACAGERHGTAQVDVVVQGTGRVTSATISGAFQGSPEGSCIARAVRGARFPQFTGEPLRFRYPFGI